MTPIDPAVGEFRVHYAGFFDPGFGTAETDSVGARVHRHGDVVDPGAAADLDPGSHRRLGRNRCALERPDRFALILGAHQRLANEHAARPARDQTPHVVL